MRLVFIYGPIASGKLTVAKELAALTGFALFHNHLIVDALCAVFPFGSAPFVKLRDEFWLSTFREAAAAKRSLIFTFAPEPTVSSDFPRRAEDVVRSAGGAVRFVKLTVSDDEQERRAMDASRAAFGKLQSLDLLRQLRPQCAACEAAMPSPVVSIDTDRIRPPEAARLISAALARGA